MKHCLLALLLLAGCTPPLRPGAPPAQPAGFRQPDRAKHPDLYVWTDTCNVYVVKDGDAALLIDSAVRQVQGNVANREALRAAMMKAEFASLRGGFKFNTNHYPIQDFYLVKVAKRPDGKYETQIVKKVFENYADPHAKDCAMK